MNAPQYESLGSAAELQHLGLAAGALRVLAADALAGGVVGALSAVLLASSGVAWLLVLCSFLIIASPIFLLRKLVSV